MNIAIVAPADVLVDKPAWAADGFAALGHHVRRCRTLAEVRRADAEADLLVFDHKGAGCGHIDLIELAAGRRSRWCQWWRDLVLFDHAPLAQQPYLRTFGRLMKSMDCVFVKERALLPAYRDLGINALWLDQGCPATMPACCHVERPDYDVLVLGSVGYAQRRADARALAAAGFRVLWAGLPGADGLPPGIDGHPWVHPLALQTLVSRAACVLSVEWRHDVDGFVSDRTWLVCGMGGCLVRRRSAGMPELPAFDYGDETELVGLVRALVAKWEVRRDTGAAARAAVMAGHTFRERAAEVLGV